MTPERIAELRALAEKATPGPWTLDYQRRSESDYDDFVFERCATIEADLWARDKSWCGATLPNESDAQFIAAARTALPEALDEIERLWLYIESKKMREGI